MLSSRGTSLNALLHRNVPQSRAPSTPRSIVTTPRPFKARRVVFAQTDEFKHTQEVHVWLFAQGGASMNGKEKRGETQTSFSQPVGELIAISRRAHVCYRKSLDGGIASSVGTQQAASSKSLLSSASVADAG
jgi:hypothetical protein